MKYPAFMNYHELRIVDARSRQSFEELLGIKIHSDTVRIPHDVYKKHAAAISAIQMTAAFNLKRP